MLFKDMSPQQLARAKAWAMSHDWGEGAYFEDGLMRGLIERWCSEAEGLCEEEAPGFKSLRDVRAWAGY